MMIFGIAISTMILVALVVFAVEVRMYKKYEANRGKLCTRQRPAGETQGAPMTS